MLGSSIPVENMSHLSSSFPVRGDAGDEVHPTQQTKKKLKLTLLFLIPGEESANELLPEDQDPEKLPRIASIRVPKGIPVAKLRSFISHIEAQLQDIYGNSKRLNFVMECDEGSNDWKYSFDLPTFGVVYV